MAMVRWLCAKHLILQHEWLHDALHSLRQRRAQVFVAMCHRAMPQVHKIWISCCSLHCVQAKPRKQGLDSAPVSQACQRQSLTVPLEEHLLLSRKPWPRPCARYWSLQYICGSTQMAPYIHRLDRVRV
jgi:hypothetical protein